MTVELIGGPADGKIVTPGEKEFAAVRILDQNGMFIALYRWERDADGDVSRGVYEATIYPD